MNRNLYEIIYLLIKFLLSYLTSLLLQKKTHKFLESKMIELLFQGKNNENDKYLVSSFYYLHYIMVKIKENNDANSAFSLVKILHQHINGCTKNSCDCKLFNKFIKTENNHKLNEEQLKDYITELLTLLNYLFESFFIEFNFYNNYYLTILLAEHYCHLRCNPTMAFSIISTLFLKQANKFSKFEMVGLYELNQKYIYFIIAKEKKDLEEDMRHNNSDLLISGQRVVPNSFRKRSRNSMNFWLVTSKSAGFPSSSSTELLYFSPRASWPQV